MALFTLSGAKLSRDHARIERAVMQEMDGATNRPIGQAYEYTASEIASRIRGGDVVHAIFLTQGHTVVGPVFRECVFSDGGAGIELDADPLQGRTILDLIIEQD